MISKRIQMYTTEHSERSRTAMNIKQAVRQILRPTASDSIHLNPRIILVTALYVVQWRREAPKTNCWHPTNLLVYLWAHQQLFRRDANMPLPDTAVRNAKRRERPQKLSDSGGVGPLG